MNVAMQTVKGIPVSPGIVIGRIFVLGEAETHVPHREIADHEIDSELERFAVALQQATADLVALRYFNERSCKEIAEQKQRTVSWVTTTLNRVRKTLRDCMESSLRSEGAS